jgi:hypothetical protein
MNITLTTIAVLLCAAPEKAESPKDEALALLGARQGEPGLAKLAGLKPPDPDLGRKVAEHAGRCRARDKIVGYALSEKALELAPGDTAVSLAHAESCLAVGQHKEAKALLDLAGKKDPASPAVRIARAELALSEDDMAAAQRHAKGLEKDPRFGQRATNVIALARSAHEKATAEALAEKQAKALSKKAAALAAAGQDEEGEPAPGSVPGDAETPASGESAVVARGGHRIGIGQETQFVAQGVRKGRAYQFRAMGACTYWWRRRIHQNESVSGLDFRVQVGAADPIPFSVASGKEDRAQASFVADSNNPTVRVFDRSSPDKEVNCNLHSFEIVAQ